MCMYACVCDVAPWHDTKTLHQLLKELNLSDNVEIIVHDSEANLQKTVLQSFK
jgi:hypothetical protein